MRINILLVFLILIINSPLLTSSNNSYVYVLRIDSEINRGTEDLVFEAVSLANSTDSPLIIILNTPGGLLEVALKIVETIRNSNIPVIAYVYPIGAKAYSAGTLILMASHVAAMAPGTQIGAAQPVMYDPATGSFKPINESKIVNPVVKQFVQLATDRGRNKTIAELFVKENLVLTEREAYENKVIEYIARNLNELLEIIDGKEIVLDNGRTYVFRTKASSLVEVGGSIRVRIVRFLSDPLVASFLSSIGVILILFSILSGEYPILPLGIALIILSFIGVGYSINTLSILLLIIGISALIVELLTPGFGILGATGVVLITLSIALMPVINPGFFYAPHYQASLFWVGVFIGVTLGSISGFVIYKVIKVKKTKPVITGSMVGSIGKSIENIPKGKEGFVMINGEYWRATALEDISINDTIIVVEQDGFRLKVKKYG